MGSVFISHVEADHELAIEIAEGLEAAGFTTWYYERDSDPGPSYLIQIHHAIEKCVALVLLISPNSIESHQMTKEVVRANDLGKPFIPVRANISHAEFQGRQPEWNIAIGAAASIPVPPTGVSGIMPRIVRGLGALGPHKTHDEARQENREQVHRGSIVAAAATPVNAQAITAPVTPPIASSASAPVASFASSASPDGLLSGDIVQHGTVTLGHTTVLTDHATSAHSRQTTAMAVAAAVVLIAGMYFVTLKRSPASDPFSVAPSSVESPDVSKPTAQKELPSSTSVAPATVPKPRSIPTSQPSALAKGTVNKNLPLSEAVTAFNEECRSMLQVVHDAEKTQDLSDDARAELGRIGRRLEEMQPEFAQNERDMLLTKVEVDTHDFEVAKRQLLSTSSQESSRDCQTCSMKSRRSSRVSLNWASCSPTLEFERNPLA